MVLRKWDLVQESKEKPLFKIHFGEKILNEDFFVLIYIFLFFLFSSGMKSDKCT